MLTSIPKPPNFPLVSVSISFPFSAQRGGAENYYFTLSFFLALMIIAAVVAAMEKCSCVKDTGGEFSLIEDLTKLQKEKAKLIARFRSLKDDRAALEEEAYDNQLVLDVPEEAVELDVHTVAEKMRRDGRYAKLASRVHPAVAARVEALSHHQRGTALAEVAWDE